MAVQHFKDQNPSRPVLLLLCSSAGVPVLHGPVLSPSFVWHDRPGLLFPFASRLWFLPRPCKGPWRPLQKVRKDEEWWHSLLFWTRTVSIHKVMVQFCPGLHPRSRRRARLWCPPYHRSWGSAWSRTNHGWPSSGFLHPRRGQDYFWCHDGPHQGLGSRALQHTSPAEDGDCLEAFSRGGKGPLGQSCQALWGDVWSMVTRYPGAQRLRPRNSKWCSRFQTCRRCREFGAQLWTLAAALQTPVHPFCRTDSLCCLTSGTSAKSEWQVPPWVVLNSLLLYLHECPYA